MNFLNKIFITVLSVYYLCMPVFAEYSIDTSVDSEIRKKYNPKKIEEDLLPPLPENLKNDVPLKSNEDFLKPSVQKNAQNQTNFMSTPKTHVYNSLSGQKLTLKKGTKFTVRLTSGVSDKTPAGTKVYFRLSKPIVTKYFSMPANTRFSAVVVDSHAPQISSNGGLLVLRFENVIINGKSQEINAKVTKVNYKNIYFNNIKGKHTYFYNVEKCFKPEKRFYDRMWKSTKKLANDSVTVIFTPITFATGLVVLGAGVVSSPVLALFSKGGSISIPANSAFEIKLMENTMLYN